MDCKTIREDLSAFLDNELDKIAAEAVEQHTHSCADCHAELTALRSLLVLIPAGEVEPPPNLRTRIALATVGAPNPAPIRVVHRAGAFLRLHYAKCASATAIVALVIIVVYSSGRPPSDAASRAYQALPNARIAVPTITTANQDSPVGTTVVTANVVSTRPVPLVVTASMPEKKAQRLPSTIPAGARQPVRPRPELPDRTSEVSAANPERSEEPVAAPVVVPPVAEEEKEVQVSTPQIADNKKTEGTPPPAHKVKLAAGEQKATPGDEQAMIRSIKKQLRMQTKGEGIYVDVVGINF